MDDALRRSAAHVFVADVDAPSLDESTRHHVVRVLRLRDGEPLTVSDGVGRWRSCRLSGGDLRVDGEIVVEDASAAPVSLCVAMPKGDRADWLVQKCTEVGVDRIVILSAERSVVRWDGERGERHVERLRRVAREAAAQSRRVWLPEVVGPVRPADVLSDGAVAVAEPGGRPFGPDDTTVAIGPEGGWSSAELALAGDYVCLGPHILRVETAAIVAATMMLSFRTVAR